MKRLKRCTPDLRPDEDDLGAITPEFAVLSPTVQTALTLENIERSQLGQDYRQLDINLLIDLLVKNTKRFHYDDIRGIECGLLGQASTLNLIFNQFVRRGIEAYTNDQRESEFGIAFRHSRNIGRRSRRLQRSRIWGCGYYLLGDLQSARAYCERRDDADEGQLCLAMTYKKLGRQADAETMLAKLRASDGDPGAVEYAGTYAQWGNSTQALDWLETAMRDRLPDLRSIKSSPFLDPLRNEPRFQAIERELKFPN